MIRVILLYAFIFGVGAFIIIFADEIATALVNFCNRISKFIRGLGK